MPWTVSTNLHPPTLARKSVSRLVVFLLLTFHVVLGTAQDQETQRDPVEPSKVFRKGPQLSPLDSGLDVHYDDDKIAQAEYAESSYEPVFAGLDRSIVGRQQQVPNVQVIGIVGNTPEKQNIQPGSTMWFSFQPSYTPAPQARRELLDLVTSSRSENTSIRDARRSDHEREGQDNLGKHRQSLAPRQFPPSNSPSVFASANTCLQPSFLSPQDNAHPPQLTLHAQTADPRYEPNPNLPGSQTVPFVEGFASLSMPISQVIFLGVSAPDVTKQNGSQDWSIDVAASTDAPYHAYIPETNFTLYMIDSDPNAALLVTSGLEAWARQQGMQGDVAAALDDSGPPLDIFVNNINYTGMNGLHRSYCAMQKSQVFGNHGDSSVAGFEMGITHNQPGAFAEEQFYIPGLNKTSTYLGRPSTINGTQGYGAPIIGGGGTLYPTMNFTTKRDGNCAVIYNLTFCTEVAYAVPANPSHYNMSTLRALYDDQSRALFRNFSYSLQQIPCNTTETAQYSLAAGCDNCTAAYKTWLCTVSIPKCEDFNLVAGGLTNTTNTTAPSSANPSNDSAGVDPTDSTNANPDVPDVSYLMPRNVAQSPLPPDIVQQPEIRNETLLNWLATNSSRMKTSIVDLIQPGPYMEVLPCEDLCYDLVRMCPAKLGFTCPKPGSMLMGASYGRRGTAKGGGYTCSAPGAVYYKNGAARGVSSGQLPMSVLLVGCVMGTLGLAWVGWL